MHPPLAGRSLSLWTWAELARTAADKGIVESISPQSVQRILPISFNDIGHVRRRQRLGALLNFYDRTAA